MEISIAKEDKHDMEILIDNATLAEIMRVYIQEAGADFAAWRREHPSKPAVFKISSSGESVAKVVGSAASALKKDISKLSSLVKK